MEGLHQRDPHGNGGANQRAASPAAVVLAGVTPGASYHSASGQGGVSQPLAHGLGGHSDTNDVWQLFTTDAQGTTRCRYCKYQVPAHMLQAHNAGCEATPQQLRARVVRPQAPAPTSATAAMYTPTSAALAGDTQLAQGVVVPVSAASLHHSETPAVRLPPQTRASPHVHRRSSPVQPFPRTKRSGRPKDDAWRFFMQLGKQRVRCVFCRKEFSATGTRLRSHLLKCAECPEEIQAVVTKPRNEDDGSSSEPPTKRQRLDDIEIPRLTPAKSERVCRLLIKCLKEGTVPPFALKHADFTRFLAALRPDFTIPSLDALQKADAAASATAAAVAAAAAANSAIVQAQISAPVVEVAMPAESVQRLAVPVQSSVPGRHKGDMARV